MGFIIGSFTFLYSIIVYVCRVLYERAQVVARGQRFGSSDTRCPASILPGSHPPSGPGCSHCVSLPLALVHCPPAPCCFPSPTPLPSLVTFHPLESSPSRYHSLLPLLPSLVNPFAQVNQPSPLLSRHIYYLLTSHPLILLPLMCPFLLLWPVYTHPHIQRPHTPGNGCRGKSRFHV